MAAFRVSRRSSDAKLNSAERKLLAEVVLGALVDLRTGRTGMDDPSGGARWGRGRTIRAGLLARLLTGNLTPKGGRPQAVKLRGARIVGPLDLMASTIICPLLLRDCYFDEPVNFEEAAAPAIHMPGCHLPALYASQLRITRSMWLNDGFTATGEINLDGARIGGQLSFDGAKLASADGVALSADGLTVEYDLLFDEGFTATGEINLDRARIGGQLSLNGAKLINSGETALSGEALTADRGMSCQFGFSAEGEVHLNAARIGSHLILDGASLANPGKTALNADHLTVDGSMSCGDGFSAEGEVRLNGAHIGGQLSMEGASLANPGKTALYAQGLTVTYDIHCRNGFTAVGAVDFNSARTGGLSFNGATLTNPDGDALIAQGLTADRGMHCRDGFAATGQIDLIGASIGTDLDFTGAKLANPTGIALNLEEASVRTLLLPQERPDGEVDFTNAKVGVLDDDPESWPFVLHLQGFVYDSFENPDVSTRARLQWLKLQPGRFVPQLYDQLAEAYRRAGDESAARTVAVAKQWHRRRAFNPLNWLWYATVGYGYRTWLAGIWLVALVILGTWVFSGAYPARMIATNTHPPAFHAPAYALDLLLPVVGLGQKSAWQPQGSALLYWSWVLTAAGWILTTAVVAGLTGILKRT
jgi:hypothetical protein